MRYGDNVYVNMERGRRVSRSKLNYKVLNALSTVDIEDNLKGKRTYKRGSKVYMVERLISRRRLKNNVCVFTFLAIIFCCIF
jgi:hypothetical protein